ncbi:MAG: type I methionyl aminopeptidase [Planctomycetes bacterium]|nr:type I methionyl aminopeptidase [Planctomycetota bacterium]
MITYKSKREIERMRSAGQVIAKVFDLVGDLVRPGITTGEIDAKVEEFICSEGGTPSFKGYHGFPGSICASVNDEIVHGIPSDRELADGDLFTIDVGVIIRGYHGDAARSFPVGAVSADVARLAAATAEALNDGIQACRPGNRLSDIARAVEARGRGDGYGIVKQYVGHGIGTDLHEEPQVPNYVSDSLLKSDLVLKRGLVIAIEPMFNLGTGETRTLDDEWTVVTKDGKCSAHFEDTVAITDDGPEIMTRPIDRQDLRIWSVSA